MKPFFLTFALLTCVWGLSSCSGGSSSSGGGGGNNQQQAQHLYVSTDSQILVYTLPITSSSTPSVVVSNPTNPLAAVMAVDSKGNLATEDFSDHIALYTAPLSSSSNPSATFNNGAFTTVEGIGFDTAGDLFAGGALDSSGTGSGVNIFKPPFSSASTPSQTVPLSGSGGSAGFDGTDAAGNIYTIQDSFTLCTGQVLAPPYTGAPTTVYTANCGFNDVSGGGFIVSGNQVYAIFVVSLGGFITITPVPANSGSTTQIGLPGNPGAFAVDSDGNIYVVGDSHNPQFTVFSRPFSTNSSGSIVPSTTVTVSNAKSIMSMAVGK